MHLKLIQSLYMYSDLSYHYETDFIMETILYILTWRNYFMNIL